MAVQKVKRIEIISLQEEKARVLDTLHELGVMHLSTVDSMETSTDLARDRGLDLSREISELILHLKWLEEQLREFSTPQKKPPIKELHIKKDLALAHELKKRGESLLPITQRYEEVKERLIELQKKRDTLAPIPFNITTEQVNSTHIKLFLVQHNEELRIPRTTTLLKQGYQLVQCLKEHEKEVQEILSKQQITPVDLGIINVSLSKDGIEDRKETQTLEKEKQQIESQLRKENKYYPAIIKLLEKLDIYKERYEKTAYFLSTQKTFIMQGYIPTKDFKKLNESKIKIHVRELPLGDFIPIKLKHPRYVKHYAFITKMFGLPEYTSVDPTLYISLFLPFFFGFMFSDVGYGLLVLLSSGLLFKTATKEKPILYDAAVVLLTCGLSTTFFGILFGSFFGSLFGFTPIWFDPFANARTIMIFALGIGIIHLNIGLAVSLYQGLKQKNNTTLLNVASLWSLQLGCLFLGLGMRTLGFIVLALSVALFIKKSSVMGLMEITGFVGTWFSYARLLALALATGGIALGINIIGDLLLGIPYGGAVFMVIILIVGHLFNFALNILGSTVHSVRLHYIEFFSQFYNAGGKPFVTFTTKREQNEL